jgi:hypothetical protein
MDGRVKGSFEKLLSKAKNNPAGLRFTELQRLCEAMGMTLDRVNGSHFIYRHNNPFFIMPIQKFRDGKAKHYQVTQLLRFIDKYHLHREE